jgi:plasmid stabilization system protein ParE
MRVRYTPRARDDLRDILEYTFAMPQGGPGKAAIDMQAAAVAALHALLPPSDG